MHHRYSCAKLDKVIEGDIRRLMIFQPPGTAKSKYGSIKFPAYYLGRRPKKNIIAASYGDILASSFGRKVRNLIDTPLYQNAFPGTMLSEDLKAKGEWETSEGGSYFAAGVGSGIAGRRSDLGLIDDPIKSREDADSQTVRDRIWNWYLGDFIPRLKPGAAQIIIQTRWHQDDLAGRILPDNWKGESGDIRCKDGQIWHVVCIPAEARSNDPIGRAPGEFLWLEWFGQDFWNETKQIQKTNDIRNWSSLYQQLPTPEDGSFFKRDWFKRRYRFGEEPKALSRYGASDYAVTKDDGDFSELGVGGFDDLENLWLLAWWSGQTTADAWIAEEIRLAKEYQTLIWVAEAGVIRRAVEPFFEKEMRGRAYHRKEWIATSGDKMAMARAFQGLASQGKVIVPLCPWGDALIEQLVAFPSGRYDDMVDVCGLLGRLLNQTYGPRSEAGKPSAKADDYGVTEEDDDENWKTG